MNINDCTVKEDSNGTEISAINHLYWISIKTPIYHSANIKSPVTDLEYRTFRKLGDSLETS